jgi:hypothetical protein
MEFFSNLIAPRHQITNRHPEVLGASRRASKGDGPWPIILRGSLRSHLRMTEAESNRERTGIK